jgi:hypothetical protein
MKNYGNGISTGLNQTALSKVNTELVCKDVSMTSSDSEILKSLAEEVAEIASSPENEGARQLWKKINKLQKTRPVIFCDPENGWNEIITEAQMKCRGKLARRWEMDMRKEIFWGREMGDDRPVEPYFDVPYTVSPDNWGVEAVYHKTEEKGSYVWDNPIKDYASDLKKIHFPEFKIDWETTNGCLDIAKRIFGGILEVRLKGIWWWSLGVTLPAATFRGLQNILYDFIEHPEELKELLSIISKGHLNKLDYLEKNKLLSLNNDGTYVGSGGLGFTDELPGEGFKGGVRSIDMWGFTESQETLNVSPEMYEKFVFPYEKPIMDRFGLTCYGCCEPLQLRWNIVKKHSNLRRVSCSPWVDIGKMAEYLEDKYIFSMKPNPAVLAMPEINLESIRNSLREAFNMTKGCIVEVIMKDNHTIGERPENLVEWCRIAREEADRV